MPIAAGLIGALAEPVSKIASELIDNLFETDEEKAAAKIKLLQAQSEGRLKETEVALKAIIAEANSRDPWTSRARPSFFYVMYIFILSAIPFGIFALYNPEGAMIFQEALGQYLRAIPDSLYTLFGMGYLGYSGFRSWEKKNGLAK